MRRAFILLAAAAVIAGCGSSSSTSSTSSGSAAATPAGGAYGSSPAPASTPGAGAVTVTTSKGRLGTFLVDGQGRTLYLFEADHGPKSVCNGTCAQAWPPLTGTPKAAGAVKAGMLGTTKRADGTTEVTYNGHPLYTYAGDSTAGQANGQGLTQFGAGWYVLSPKGAKIDES